MPSHKRKCPLGTIFDRNFRCAGLLWCWNVVWWVSGVFTRCIRVSVTMIDVVHSRPAHTTPTRLWCNGRTSGVEVGLVSVHKILFWTKLLPNWQSSSQPHRVYQACLIFFMKLQALVLQLSQVVAVYSGHRPDCNLIPLDSKWGVVKSGDSCGESKWQPPYWYGNQVSQSGQSQVYALWSKPVIWLQRDYFWTSWPRFPQTLPQQVAEVGRSWEEAVYCWPLGSSLVHKVFISSH